jgi:hypothetical protein
MAVAFEGKTPNDKPIFAMLCPKCASVKYFGDTADPTFQLIQTMQKAIGSLWLDLQDKEQVKY